MKGTGVLQPKRIDAADLYVALVHYPVYNKRGCIVCTAVTNLDIHDLARCAGTFGVGVVYFVNPLDSQRELIARIIRHWTEGLGARYNPIRKGVFDRVRVRVTLGEVVDEISQVRGQRVRTVATGAAWYKGAVSYEEMRRLLHRGTEPYLLILGTGWGLAREILDNSDYVLAPIEGVSDYNHLSVRSAGAIMLDRLMGNR
ncbi:MAG: RNA methyltransferase [Deltaproteobacteria bacterium]|nr:RNA methyltransferase [Deltaproteobacteria bacterium]MBW2120769.1 RNA methyltransferase [Deltaproteobacteria bacterium]